MRQLELLTPKGRVAGGRAGAAVSRIVVTVAMLVGNVAPLGNWANKQAGVAA